VIPCRVPTTTRDACSSKHMPRTRHPSAPAMCSALLVRLPPDVCPAPHGAVCWAGNGRRTVHCGHREEQAGWAAGHKRTTVWCVRQAPATLFGVTARAMLFTLSGWSHAPMAAIERPSVPLWLLVSTPPCLGRSECGRAGVGGSSGPRLDRGLCAVLYGGRHAGSNRGGGGESRPPKGTAWGAVVLPVIASGCHTWHGWELLGSVGCSLIVGCSVLRPCPAAAVPHSQPCPKRRPAPSLRTRVAMLWWSARLGWGVGCGVG
jgi:hypothetical protein